jgi:hypothetical protein
MNRKSFPGGAGYNIEFSGVDYEGLFVPASGGLRSHIARTDHRAPVALHAGDSIAFCRAKMPQVVSRRRSVRSAGVRVEARC